MKQDRMRKDALRRYAIARLKDVELMHLHLVLMALVENKFLPENIVGFTSNDFARSIQTVALAWFATIVDQSRDGLNIFDLWRQLFPKHRERINEVWKKIEPWWSLVRTHRDRVAFHADKPRAYFKAMLEVHENMGDIVAALGTFLELSIFFLKIEDEELPDFGQVVNVMLKEIGDELGYEISPQLFSKLLKMPME